MAFLEASMKVYLQSDLGLTFLLYFKCHTVDSSPDGWFCPFFFLSTLLYVFQQIDMSESLAVPWFRTWLLQVTISHTVLSCDKWVLMKFLSFHTVLLQIILFLMQATLMKRPLINYWNHKRLRISILSALFSNRKINANCIHLTGFLSG